MAWGLFPLFFAAAIWLVAALTFVSGLVAALRMEEALRALPAPVPRSQTDAAVG